MGWGEGDPTSAGLWEIGLPSDPETSRVDTVEAFITAPPGFPVTSTACYSPEQRNCVWVRRRPTRGTELVISSLYCGAYLF